MAVIYLLLTGGAFLEWDSRATGWPYLATGLFVAFVVVLFRRQAAGVMILMPIIITRILLLVSLIFIAQGFFIRELGLSAYGSVHACYFALIGCAFLHLALVTFRALGVALPVQSGRTYPMAEYLFVTAALATGIMTTGYLLLTGAQQGFALLTGTDRFEYRADQGWLFGVIITFKPIICAMLGFARFRMRLSPITRTGAVATFLALLLTSTLFGDKFLSLIVMIVYFFMPYVVLQGRISRRIGIIGAAVALVGGAMVSALTYYTYSDYGTLGAEATSERLFGRFTGQGQLWYAVNNRSVDPMRGDPEEAQALKAVMLAPSGADDLAFSMRTGIFKMVERFALDNIRDAVFGSRGLVQFTGAGEAYLVLVFGHGGMLLLMALLAVGCGIFLYYVYNALVAGSLLGFIFSIFILSNYSSMINQGSFWQIFGVRALVYIGAIIAIDAGSRLVTNRRAPPRGAA